jgi:hypothetical protein
MSFIVVSCKLLCNLLSFCFISCACLYVTILIMVQSNVKMDEFDLSLLLCAFVMLIQALQELI